jgi:hypothetical protein
MGFSPDPRLEKGMDHPGTKMNTPGCLSLFCGHNLWIEMGAKEL